MNTIGPLLVPSCTLHVPESGSWVLEAGLELPPGAPAPTGKVPCLVGGVPFLGTVDPAAAGTFGTRARVRVVGAFEWGSTVRKQDFANPAGVLSSMVITATAAEVGIPAVVLLPELLGTHFTRVAGPASQVLGRAGWWVDPVGVTTVGPRPPSVTGLDFFMSEYDPLTRIAKVTSSTPIMPGTVIADIRLPGGVLRVREVTQTWDENGASASLWLGEMATAAKPQGPRLVHAIQGIATAAMRPDLLTHHVYTVVSQMADGSYMLLSEVLGPVPDALPVVHWPGIPGFSCDVMPGTKVLVGFRGSEPVVIGFDKTPPLSCTWDYLELKLGGELAKPIANADIIDAVLDLLQKVNAAHNGSSTVPYAGFDTEAAAIKAKFALMKTKVA